MVLLCEGAKCNGGMSASDMARQIGADRGYGSAALIERFERDKAIRAQVSSLLRYTPHRHDPGTDPADVTCSDCGHTRRFGAR